MRRFLAPLSVIGLVVAVTCVTIWAPDWWQPFTPELEAMRSVNPYLAVIAVIVLTMRVTEAWAERPGREQMGHLLFIGYISAAALGAVQGALLGSPVGPTTAVLTVLHVVTITLMAAWPRVAPVTASDKDF